MYLEVSSVGGVGLACRRLHKNEITQLHLYLEFAGNNHMKNT